MYLAAATRPNAKKRTNQTIMTKQLARWLSPLLLFLPLLAAGQGERPPVTNAYFIQNAIVVQQPGTVLEMGGVIIRDGLIQAVGKNLTAPADAKVLEGDSLYVYAGFIDGLSNVGIPKPKEETGRPEVKDPGNPTNAIAGIQPERSAADMVDASDKSVEELLALGFTAAHVVPYGRMLPGQGAIILLGGQGQRGAVYRPESSFFSQFEGSRGVYPATTMAIMAKWRELYLQAKQSKDHSARYSSAARGMARTAYDETLEAFYPVIDGKQPVFFAVENVKDAFRALGLAKEMGFKLALANVDHVEPALADIKAAKTPLFLSLALPEEKKKEEKKEEAKEGEKTEETPPSTPKDAADAKMEERRAAAQQMFEEQAATVAKAGVSFGFSTLTAKSKDIRANLGRMIKAGLTEDQALAALTTAPAALLGLSDVMGTVEKGKIANLVVTDKPYFAEGSNVRYVIVDGVPKEYDAKKKKKASDPDAKVSAAGTWTITIDVPGQTTTSVLEITGTADDLSGTITAEGETRTLSNVALAGDALTFNSKFDAGGQSLDLSFDLTVDGDSIDGSVQVGSFGTFDVEGSRTSKPDRQ